MSARDLNAQYPAPPIHPRFQVGRCVCGHPLHETVDGLNCFNCSHGGEE